MLPKESGVKVADQITRDILTRTIRINIESQSNEKEERNCLYHLYAEKCESSKETR